METLDYCWAHRNELLAAIGTVWVSVLAILKAALVVAHITETTEDDKKIMRLIRFMEGVALAQMKPRSGRAPQPERARVSDTFPVVVLALALGSSALTTGCAGTAPEVQDARIARWDLWLGLGEQDLLAIGEWLDPIYRQAEEECHRGDAYEACIQRWDRAIDALSSAYYTVRIGRDGLALGDGAALPPCLASVVGEAVAAVRALELDLPEKVEKGLHAAQALAELLDGECRVTS